MVYSLAPWALLLAVCLARLREALMVSGQGICSQFTAVLSRPHAGTDYAASDSSASAFDSSGWDLVQPGAQSFGALTTGSPFFESAGIACGVGKHAAK